MDPPPPINRRGSLTGSHRNSLSTLPPSTPKTPKTPLTRHRLSSVNLSSTTPVALNAPLSSTSSSSLSPASPSPSSSRRIGRHHRRSSSSSSSIIPHSPMQPATPTFHVEDTLHPIVQNTLKSSHSQETKEKETVREKDKDMNNRPVMAHRSLSSASSSQILSSALSSSSLLSSASSSTSSVVSTPSGRFHGRSASLAMPSSSHSSSLIPSSSSSSSSASSAAMATNAAMALKNKLLAPSSTSLASSSLSSSSSSSFPPAPPLTLSVSLTTPSSSNNRRFKSRPLSLFHSKTLPQHFSINNPNTINEIETKASSLLSPSSVYPHPQSPTQDDLRSPSVFQRLQSMLEFGIVATKLSMNGRSKPSRKRIFYKPHSGGNSSQNNNISNGISSSSTVPFTIPTLSGSVCWMDVKSSLSYVPPSTTSSSLRKDDPKRSLPLSEITDIYLGKQTTAFTGKAGKSLQEELCCSIVSMKRTLDLECETQLEREDFVEQLVGFAKKNFNITIHVHRQVANTASSSSSSSTSSVPPSVPSSSSSSPSLPHTPIKNKSRSFSTFITSASSSASTASHFFSPKKTSPLKSANKMVMEGGSSTIGATSSSIPSRDSFSSSHPPSSSPHSIITSSSPPLLFPGRVYSLSLHLSCSNLFPLGSGILKTLCTFQWVDFSSMHSFSPSSSTSSSFSSPSIVPLCHTEGIRSLHSPSFNKMIDVHHVGGSTQFYTINIYDIGSLLLGGKEEDGMGAMGGTGELMMGHSLETSSSLMSLPVPSVPSVISPSSSSSSLSSSYDPLSPSSHSDDSHSLSLCTEFNRIGSAIFTLDTLLSSPSNTITLPIFHHLNFAIQSKLTENRSSLSIKLAKLPMDSSTLFFNSHPNLALPLSSLSLPPHSSSPSISPLPSPHHLSMLAESPLAVITPIEREKDKDVRRSSAPSSLAVHTASAMALSAHNHSQTNANSISPSPSSTTITSNSSSISPSSSSPLSSLTGSPLLRSYIFTSPSLFPIDSLSSSASNSHQGSGNSTPRGFSSLSAAVGTTGNGAGSRRHSSISQSNILNVKLSNLQKERDSQSNVMGSGDNGAIFTNKRSSLSSISAVANNLNPSYSSSTFSTNTNGM